MRLAKMVAMTILCLTWLAGCGATNAKVATAAVKKAAAAANTAKVGETVTQKYVALTVMKIDDPATANAVALPAAGTRWVALDIEVRNLDTQPHDYDLPLYSLVRATDNYEFGAMKLGVVQPALTPVAVAGGSSQRGWLTFQLPTNKQPDYFLYAPSDGSGVRITVSLTK